MISKFPLKMRAKERKLATEMITKKRKKDDGTENDEGSNQEEEERVRSKSKV
jgi:hypothetical protein